MIEQDRFRRSRLPAFGDSFNDVGREVGKAKGAPHIMLAEIVPRCDRSCICIFPTMQGFDPGSPACHCK